MVWGSEGILRLVRFICWGRKPKSLSLRGSVGIGAAESSGPSRTESPKQNTPQILP